MSVLVSSKVSYLPFLASLKLAIMKWFFIPVLFFVLLICSCSDDDTEIITEVVTVRDTITVVEHDTSIIVTRDTTIIIERDTLIEIANEDSSVIVYCVRHAETTGAGGNPSLSAEGLIRADDLANALSNVELSAVYSTNFNRTRETATATANDQGLSVQIYDAFNIPAFSDQLIESYKGKSVLVVGHSNTTPQLLNALTKSGSFIVFDENTYDNLYIVNVKITGETVVYHLEYGEDTP